MSGDWFSEDTLSQARAKADRVGLGPMWADVEASGVAGLERQLALSVIGSVAQWLLEDGYRVVKAP